MKRDLETILAEIRAGKVPPLFLLHGDDFRVHEASKALLDLLVPQEDRAFKLEQFDGRSTPWGEIEASLMTPPFLPGRKAVVVESAPYFYSREHKGELGEKVLRLWGEEKREEAARLFLDLLFLEGWTQERWERAQGALSTAEMAELFGPESPAAAKEVETLLAFCRSHGMDLSQPRAGEGHRLLDLMEKGLPPWGILLITASQPDRRTRLYRALEEKGVVLDLSVERDRSGRINREALADFVDRRLKEAGKRIEPKGKEMILARSGEEIWAVHQELEKLLLYVGAEPRIKTEDVEEVFLDRGEAWVFDLTAAIAERDSMRALGQLARLLSQGEHPLRLLGTIASEVRRLIAARHLIEGEMRHRWERGMSFPQFQRMAHPQGAPLLTRSLYGDYLSLRRAENFTNQELLRYLEWIFETDVRLKSTANPPRLVMERLILKMCQPVGTRQIAR